VKLSRGDLIDYNGSSKTKVALTYYIAGKEPTFLPIPVVTKIFVIIYTFYLTKRII